MVAVSLLPTTIGVTASGNSAGESGSGVSVAVVKTQVTATAVGGPGATGPQGPPGAQSMTGLTDVEFAELQAGDLLRYENSRWRNYAEENLTDGGNF